eukprot:gene689-754_t
MVMKKRRSARKSKRRSKRKAKKTKKRSSKKKKAGKKAAPAKKVKSTRVHDGGKKPAAPKGKQMNKSEVTQALEDMSGVQRKVCKKVYEGLLELVYHEMEKRKMFSLHGICKFVTKRRKARKAGKGINPFTKEPCIIKARPACNIPRVRVMKALKDQIA